MAEMATYLCLGSSKEKENQRGLNGNASKLKITLASNAEGWDTVVNGQLENALAQHDRVRVTGFVPENTQEQRKHARELNIALFDAKYIPGFSSIELLAYPPDDLVIDILMMHSYGRNVGRQAQIIKEAKNCMWVLVVHTISEELETFLKKSASSSAVHETVHESEHELQVTLCEKADFVIAVGPKVAEAYKAALRYCGKQDKIFTLMPRILGEYLDVRQATDTKCCDAGEKFRILISSSSKYFKVKGCDIAAKAIKLLQDSSYHLILAVQANDDTAELEEAMHKEGISEHQLTVRRCSGATETWCRLLCEVDLLIKPSRTEGFGMSGLRAISADLPILISGNCGLGFTMKKLHSGQSHVVDSDEPKVWADKIKEVRAKGSKTRRFQAEKLRSEYAGRFMWEEQIDDLVKTFSEMVQQNPEGRRAGGCGFDEADAPVGRSHEEETQISIQETNQDEIGRDKLEALKVARQVDSLSISPAARRATKLPALPMQVYKQICKQLNVRREEKFDDFRILADKIGFSRDQIRDFEEKANPTDEILAAWSSTSDEATVGKLIELLNGEGLERWDVAKTLEHWIQSESLILVQ